MRESATDTASTNSPLPPSVENAYHKKCVELKKRLQEIETANDTARIKRDRIGRSISKMRIERSMLLERLAKVQNKELRGTTGAAADETDRSTSPPPTPQDRAPRRRQRSPPLDANGYPILNGSPNPFTAPRSGGTPPRVLVPNSSSFPPLNGHAAAQPNPPSSTPHGYPPHPNNPPSAPGPTRFKEPPPHGRLDRRAPPEIHPSETLPAIHNLPNGTNVVIIEGRPKQPPWTIRDVEPRHHLIPGFDDMLLEAQLLAIGNNQYCPYDVFGNPVVIMEERDENGRLVRLKQLFKEDAEWKDPVMDNVRTDDPREVARQNVLRERDQKEREQRMARMMEAETGRRSTSGAGSMGRGGSRERRRESGRESGSAPGSSHGRKEGGGSGGGFTAVNR